jgi:hypothetical protein
MLLTEKRALSLDDLDAQSAVELPERETMLVTVVIGNLLSGNTIEIDVRNVNVAAQICAAVLAANSSVTCEVQQ